MYKKLVNMLLSLSGITQKEAALQLGYKTQSALYSAIQNRDIKITVLANICKLCKFDIVITNHAGINISVLEYIKDNEQI